MAKKATLAIAALAILALSGDAKAKGVDEPTDEPPEDEPPKDKPDPTLFTTWGGLVKRVPQQNAGYSVRQGDTLLGPTGVIARVFKSAGKPGGGTGAEKRAYLQAITRVRSNWRTAGTLSTGFTPAIVRVDVRDSEGNVVSGTIGGAMMPWHDGWKEATRQGDLPARLIQWARNPNTGGLRAVGDWEEKKHSAVRHYATLWLPSIDCADLGMGVSESPQCDWPAALYQLAGTSWLGWSP